MLSFLPDQFVQSPPRVFRRRALAFLGNNVTDAANHAELNRCALYRARANHRAFGLAWEKASEMGGTALEDEAVRRAAEGRLEPVFYRNKECGQVREFSDRLLMFLLKARRPEVYGDRRTTEKEASGSLAEVLAEIDGRTRGLPSEEARRRSSPSDEDEEGLERAKRWSDDGGPAPGAC